MENKVSEISFLGELSSAIDSTPFLETENTRPGVGLSCTIEEFQKFESFFTNFIAVTREFFLPPERQRYGLISERSLLSSLGVEESDPWFAMLCLAGCHGCLKVFKEVDDLKFVSQMHNTFVSEVSFLSLQCFLWCFLLVDPSSCIKKFKCLSQNRGMLFALSTELNSY